MLTFLLALFGCSSSQQLATVKNVDLEKYAGKWYEITKLPNMFEKGLTCVTATYSLKKNGEIEVKNRGFKKDKNKWKDITGSAKVPDRKKPGELKVTFFWPFYGDYYIMELGENYEYALVGDPSRKYLWILCREPKLDADIKAKLIEIARAEGFAVEELEDNDQSCWEK